MCEIVTATIASAFSAIGGLGGALQVAGLVATVGGSLAQANAAKSTAEANAKFIDQQRKTQAQIAGVEDMRTRQQFRRAMSQQSAELARRGVQLDSPTAMLLGQTAAREMSYASQSVRSGAQARDQELSMERRNVLARGQSDWLRGTLSGAGRLLTSAPDIWPELQA
jgi:hypothetical protein